MYGFNTCYTKFYTAKWDGIYFEVTDCMECHADYRFRIKFMSFFSREQRSVGRAMATIKAVIKKSDLEGQIVDMLKKKFDSIKTIEDWSKELDKEKPKICTDREKGLITYSYKRFEDNRKAFYEKFHLADKAGLFEKLQKEKEFQAFNFKNKVICQFKTGTKRFRNVILVCIDGENREGLKQLERPSTVVRNFFDDKSIETHEFPFDNVKRVMKMNINVMAFGFPFERKPIKKAMGYLDEKKDIKVFGSLFEDWYWILLKQGNITFLIPNSSRMSENDDYEFIDILL